MNVETMTAEPRRNLTAAIRREWTSGFIAGVDAGAVQADYEAAMSSGAPWEPMNGEDLRKVRKERFGDSREAFSRRSGVPLRSLQRYEAGESPVPAWMSLVVAALLYDLPPYKPEDEQ